MLSGVCGGLGHYFSVDPLILRIAFAVSVFFGGLGVVLYLAVAALVPVDDAPDGKPLVSLDRKESVAAIIGIAVLVIAIPIFGALFAWVGDPTILWLLATVVLVVAAVTVWRDRGWRGRAASPTGDPAAPAPQQPRPSGQTTEVRETAPGAETAETAVSPPLPPAATAPTEVRSDPRAESAAQRRPQRSNLLTVVLVCGTALLSMAGFFAAALTVGFGLGPLVAATVVAGGLAVFALAFAAGSGGRWLIAPLIAMVLGAGAAEAADLDLEGGVGQETYRPQHAASIPADGFRLGAGHLVVDLRDFDWQGGRGVPIEASAGVGFVEIVVPRDVCVTGEARSRAGYVAIAGDEDSGFDSRAHGLTLRDAPAGAADDRPATRGGKAQGSRRDLVPRPTEVVSIDASVDFGAVQVRNDGSGPDTDDPKRLSQDSLSEMRRLNDRACAG